MNQNLYPQVFLAVAADKDGVFISQAKLHHQEKFKRF